MPVIDSQVIDKVIENPIATKAEAKTMPATDKGAESSLLIVDDDKPFLTRLARAMESRGYAVVPPRRSPRVSRPSSRARPPSP